MTKRKRSYKKKERYIKVCPECGSIEVFGDKSNPVAPRMGLPERWVCRRCGHSAYSFPEVEESKVPKFSEIASRNIMRDMSEKVDIAYGRFSLHGLWKLSGPVVFFLGLLMLYMTQEGMPLFIPFAFILAGLFMIYYAYLKRWEKWN